MKHLSIFLIAMSLTSSLFGQVKLSDLKAPFTNYRVSTINCSKIIHQSGSVIYIPSKAFAVNISEVDSVNILYREIRTPVETVVNNLRMTTQLMGKSYLLASNGMFEIYCLNGKDTVEVHEDRSIVVRLALEKSEADITIEGFKYNSDNNNWDSYTDRIQNLFLNDNDDDLWGSNTVESLGEPELISEGWADDWLLDPEWSRQDSLRQVAFQTMEVFDFGLYNYDKIITGEEFVPYVPTFVDAKNEEIKSDIYVIYKGINSVIYFSSYNWKIDFSLIKGRDYSMFTIDEEGQIYKLNTYPQLGASGSEVTFILEPKGTLPKSADQLTNLIGAR